MEIKLTEEQKIIIRNARALCWWQAGFNVVVTPVGHGAEHITWGRWQHNRQTKGQLRWMLDHHPDYLNVALVTGWNNHFVLDCDSEQEYQAIIEKYPFLKDCSTVKSKDGYHIHLIVENLPEKLPSKHDLGCELWGHGHFAQAPLSVHDSGYVYNVFIDKPMMTIDSIEEIGVLPSVPCNKKSGIPTNDDLFLLRGPTRQYNGERLSDKLKREVSIVDLLGDCDYIESSRDGKYLLGFCPYHHDTTRSLSVDTHSNRCNCLSANCGFRSARGYSVIDLYMYQEGLTDSFEAMMQMKSEFSL